MLKKSLLLTIICTLFLFQGIKSYTSEDYSISQKYETLSFYHNFYTFTADYTRIRVKLQTQKWTNSDSYRVRVFRNETMEEYSLAFNSSANCYTCYFFVMIDDISSGDKFKLVFSQEAISHSVLCYIDTESGSYITRFSQSIQTANQILYTQSYLYKNYHLSYSNDICALGFTISATLEGELVNISGTLKIGSPSSDLDERKITTNQRFIVRSQYLKNVDLYIRLRVMLGDVIEPILFRLKVDIISFEPYSLFGEDKCGCLPSETFNPNTLLCQIDHEKICEEIPYAIKGYQSIKGQCECHQGFYWNHENKTCDYDCRSFAFSTGVSLQPGVCECLEGYFWDGNSTNCRSVETTSLKYCHSILNTTVYRQNYTVSSRCECVSGYVWNNNTSSCLLDCQNVNLGVNSLEKCRCTPGYRWSSFLQICNKTYDESNYQINGSSNGVASKYYFSNQFRYIFSKSSTKYRLRISSSNYRNYEGELILIREEGKTEKIVFSAILTKYWLIKNVNRGDSLSFKINFFNRKYSQSTNNIQIFDYDSPSNTYSTSNPLLSGFQKLTELPFYFTGRIYRYSSECYKKVKLVVKDEQGYYPHEKIIISTISNNNQKQFQKQITTNQDFYLSISGYYYDCKIFFKSLPDSGFLSNYSRFHLFNLTWESYKLNYSSGENYCGCQSGEIFSSDRRICIFDTQRICENVKYANPYSLNTEGYCRCSTNYYWDHGLQKCMKDCSFVYRSTGRALQVEVCQCQPGYVWESVTGRCEMNCSSFSYASNEEIFGYSNECQCPSELSWDPLEQQCSCFDNSIFNNAEQVCETFYNENGIQSCNYNKYSYGNLLENGECHCKPNAFWNKEYLKCEPICFLDSYSTGVVLHARNKCQCKEGFTWDDKLLICRVSCELVTDSTGQNRGLYACECKRSSVWDYNTFTCEQRCEFIKFSTGEKNATGDCVCMDGYIWNRNESTCMSNCQTEPFTTGNVIGTKCECISSYIWDFEEEKCKPLNCSSIPYAQGPTDDNNSCICANEKFQWNNYLSICEIDCASSNNSLSLGEKITINECVCETHALWSFTAFECVRDCSLDALSTGVNVNADECQCKEGYYWELDEQSSNPQCVLDCGRKPGELETFNEAEQHCNCKDGFYFSFSFGSCALDCNLKNNSVKNEGPSPVSCDCISGFDWNFDTIQCQLSCKGAFDSSVNAAGTGCLCQAYAVYNTDYKTCMINCSMDNLSTKEFFHDQCLCKDNAEWNSTINQCGCEQGYSDDNGKCVGTSVQTAALGALGGVLFSALSFGTVMTVKLVKKKKEEREEGQEEERNPNIESHKELDLADDDNEIQVN